MLCVSHQVKTGQDTERDFQFHRAPLLSNMTLEVWVFVDDGVAASTEAVVVASRQSPDASSNMWQLSVTPQGALVFDVRDAWHDGS